MRALIYVGLTCFAAFAQWAFTEEAWAPPADEAIVIRARERFAMVWLDGRVETLTLGLAWRQILRFQIFPDGTFAALLYSRRPLSNAFAPSGFDPPLCFPLTAWLGTVFPEEVPSQGSVSEFLWPAQHPHERKLAFMRGYDSGTSHSLHVLDLDTGHTTTIVPRKWALGAPAWSRDGREIAFYRSPPGEGKWYSLCVVRLQDGEVERVSPPSRLMLGMMEEMVDPPAWTPDGQTLFFVANYKTDKFKGLDAGPSYLHSVCRDGTQLQEVSQGLDPVCHPDGERVYFFHNEFKMLALGTGKITPILPERGIGGPRISVSGRYLAGPIVLWDDEKRGQIAIMTKEGRLLRYVDPGIPQLSGADIAWVKRDAAGRK